MMIIAERFILYFINSYEQNKMKSKDNYKDN